MFETGERRCPNCGSTDLASIRLPAIDDKLLKRRSCKKGCAW
jgi:hypothetical protein